MYNYSNELKMCANSYEFLSKELNMFPYDLLQDKNIVNKILNFKTDINLVLTDIKFYIDQPIYVTSEIMIGIIHQMQEHTEQANTIKNIISEYTKTI